jgi:hypothetical protein
MEQTLKDLIENGTALAFDYWAIVLSGNGHSATILYSKDGPSAAYPTAVVLDGAVVPVNASLTDALYQPLTARLDREHTERAAA